MNLIRYRVTGSPATGARLCRGCIGLAATRTRALSQAANIADRQWGRPPRYRGGGGWEACPKRRGASTYAERPAGSNRYTTHATTIRPTVPRATNLTDAASEHAIE